MFLSVYKYYKNRIEQNYCSLYSFLIERTCNYKQGFVNNRCEDKFVFKGIKVELVSMNSCEISRGGANEKS